MTAPSTPPTPCRSTGTARTRPPRCSAPARCSAATPTTMLGLALSGRRQGVLSRADAGHSRPQRRRLPGFPHAGPAARLVQERDHRRRAAERPEIPHSRPRRGSFPGDGRQRRAASRRRNRAGHGARRHRRASSSTTRPPTCASARRTWPRTTCSAPTTRRPNPSSIIFNRDRFESLDPDLQAILEVRRRGGAARPTTRWRMNQYSTDLQKLRRKPASTSSARRTRSSQAQLEAWDKIMPRLLEEDAFFKKVVDSQKAWCERVVYYQLHERAELQARLPALLPGQDLSLTSGLTIGAARRLRARASLH